MTSGRIAAGALLAGVLAVGAVWLLWDGPADDPRSPAAGVRTDPSSPPITPRASGAAGWSIEPAETIAIDGADLPSEGTVAVDLVLGAASADARPLEGRILSMDESRDNRVRELMASVVGDERETARIQIPAEFLTRDLYLIEIKTTEKSHFPLRRYRLEVR